MFKKLTQTRLAYFVIIFLLCIAVLAYFMGLGLNGNDFWWHIKAGEWMVDNISFPKYDMFSWLGKELSLKWTAHEWLSEIVYYAIYSIGGQLATYLFCYLSAVIMLILLSYVAKDKIFKNIIFTILYLAFTTILFKSYFYGRPHLFSYFLLFFELKFLYDFIKDKSSKSVYFIPLIAMLWANFHGGSSNLSYILIIFVIITSLFNFTFGKISFEKLSTSKLLKLLAMIPACMLAICINPYGLTMLVYPYQNMADKLMLTMITEWEAPDIKNLAILIMFFIPFALCLLALISSTEKLKARDLIIFAFFSYMFLRSSRFIVFLLISVPFYIFDYVPAFGDLKEVKKKSEKIMSTILVCIFSLFALVGLVHGFKNALNGTLITHYLSEDFVDVIKEDNPSRPYTDYNYGGDLIYYGVEVYVDGRADVYTGQPMIDYYDISKMVYYSENSSAVVPDNFFEDLLDKYDFDAFLVERGRTLTSYLYQHPEKYKLVKASDSTVYFKTIQ